MPIVSFETLRQAILDRDNAIQFSKIACDKLTAVADELTRIREFIDHEMNYDQHPTEYHGDRQYLIEDVDAKLAKVIDGKLAAQS